MSVQIVRTVPGVYTGSYIASPEVGLISAVGPLGAFFDNNNPQIGDDLLEGHTIPFGYSQPTLPTNSGDTIVSSQSELNAAYGGGNRIVIDTAGAYSLSSAPSNTWVTAGVPGVTYSAAPSASNTRIRIEGGGGSTIPVLSWLGVASTDWYFKNLTINGGTSICVASNGIEEQARFAFDRCTFRSTNYGFLTENLRDWILWRCDLECTGGFTPNRMVAFDRLIEAECRFATATQAARRHNNNATGGSQFLYHAQNQLERTAGTSACLFVEPNNGGGDGAGFTMTDLYIQDNLAYRVSGDTTGWSFAIGEQTPGNMDRVTVTGNRDYSDNGTPGNTIFGINGSINNLTASDNLIQAWQAAPVYAYGAT